MSSGGRWQPGSQFEVTCDDYTNPRTGKFTKGCGKKLLNYFNGTKWIRYEVQPGSNQWIEHWNVCEARKQQAEQQQQQQQQAPGAVFGMPTVAAAASQPREAQVLQSDTLAAIQHEIGELRRDQTSLIWLIQEIAKKLEVGYPRDEQRED